MHTQTYLSPKIPVFWFPLCSKNDFYNKHLTINSSENSTNSDTQRAFDLSGFFRQILAVFWTNLTGSQFNFSSLLIRNFSYSCVFLSIIEYAVFWFLSRFLDVFNNDDINVDIANILVYLKSLYNLGHGSSKCELRWEIFRAHDGVWAGSYWDARLNGVSWCFRGVKSLKYT